MFLYVRSRLPRIYLITFFLASIAILIIMRLLEPTASIPVWRLGLAFVHLPLSLALIGPLLVLLPQQTIVREKTVKGSTQKQSIRCRQLMAWRVQERKQYRRLALRYVDLRGRQSRRAYWLAESVDRDELELRMRDFMARGEQERAKAGRP